MATRIYEPETMADTDARMFRTSEGVEAKSEAPLLSSISRAFGTLETLDEIIDQVYKRLDHLILHEPESPDDSRDSETRKARSETVNNVERLGDRIRDAHDKLQRLLRIIEA